jgi:excisionase family DNA binding protein
MLGRLLGKHDIPQHSSAPADKSGAVRSFGHGYKPRQVAEKLNLSVYTVRRYINEGRLKAVRLSPRALLILDCDLEQFLADREVKAA